MKAATPVESAMETQKTPPVIQRPQAPVPPPAAPKPVQKKAVRDGNDVFIKRGLIEVTASADDEIPVFDSAEQAVPPKMPANHISSKFKKEISAAFQAFERKKDLVISKIKHMTGAFKVPEDKGEKKSNKLWYAAASFLGMAAAFFYFYKDEAPQKAQVNKPLQVVKTEKNREAEWLSGDLKFLNQYLEKTAAIKNSDLNVEEQKFYRAEAMISVGLFNNDPKQIIRGFSESNLAAAQFENSSHRWNPLLAFGLWSDDFTFLRKVVESADKAENTAELQLAKIIVQIRKNPREATGYSELSRIIEEKPQFSLAQWWALSFSIDQPEATQSFFSQDKKDRWIQKFKIQRNELKAGLPPLFENLEKKIASHPSANAASASAPVKIAK